MTDEKFGVTKKVQDALFNDESIYKIGITRKEDFTEFTLLKDDLPIVTEWTGKYIMVDDYPLVTEFKKNIFDYSEA